MVLIRLKVLQMSCINSSLLSILTVIVINGIYEYDSLGLHSTCILWTLFVIHSEHMHGPNLASSIMHKSGTRLSALALALYEL
jgi:hypothetical protein